MGIGVIADLMTLTVGLVHDAVAILVADVAVPVQIHRRRADDVALPRPDAVRVRPDLAEPLVGGGRLPGAR